MRPKTKRVSWSFKPPPGVPWTTHRFSLIDAINVACKKLPWSKEALTLHCGVVAFAILRHLPEYLPGPGGDGPLAWVLDHEIMPDAKELSGLAISHEGHEVQVVIVGAPAEFVERAINRGFV